MSWTPDPKGGICAADDLPYSCYNERGLHLARFSVSGNWRYIVFRGRKMVSPVCDTPEVAIRSIEEGA